MRALARVQFTKAQAKKIKDDLKSRTASDQHRDIENSLTLRISEVRAREERLTDLLVDGAIDKDAYGLRKQNLEIELAQLREQLEGVQNGRSAAAEIEGLVEFATRLGSLYSAADAGQKRQIVRHCLMACCVVGGNLTAEPADWLVGDIVAAIAGNDAPMAGALAEGVVLEMKHRVEID
jgi:site-specific DNA recombinase